MNIKKFVRDLFAAFPRADALFRRAVWSRVHFPENEMRFLHSLPPSSIDIAIDIGAAHGSYAWILNRKARRVYCFEPGEQHATYLRAAVVGTRIELVEVAVGNNCSKVSMYTPGTDENALHSATLSTSNPVIGVPNIRVRQVAQVTLDNFFINKLDAGRSVDIIKVDVEGYELQVFEGAEALLLRHYPLVFCEIETRHNAAYGRVFKLLRGLGYSCFVYRNGSFKSFIDERIEFMQRDEDLKVRLSSDYNPSNNCYINNFVFQHDRSRIKVNP